MLSNIDAPDGFFSNDPDGVITTPPTTNLPVPVIPSYTSIPLVKPTGTSKFSFSKFGSSKFTKQTVQPLNTQTSMVPMVESSIQSSGSFVVYKGSKIPYSYNKERNPILSKNLNVTSDFNSLLQQRESNKDVKLSEREIEERQAMSSVMDMFGDATSVLEESTLDEARKNSMVDKANEYLGKLSRNVFIAKPDKSIKNGILPEIVFGSISELFEYMNPEERGRMIINIIFGGLISRSKLSGFAGKSASKEFPKIISAIDKLKHGGISGEPGHIYNKTLEHIIQNGNRYRMDLTAADQVINVANFIDKIARRGLPVYFPSNMLFSDPIIIKDTPTKSLPLNGKPTLEHLNVFFGFDKQITQQTQAKNETAKKAEDAKKLADKRKGTVARGDRMEEMEDSYPKR